MLNMKFVVLKIEKYETTVFSNWNDVTPRRELVIEGRAVFSLDVISKHISGKLRGDGGEYHAGNIFDHKGACYGAIIPNWCNDTIQWNLHTPLLRFVETLHLPLFVNHEEIPEPSESFLKHLFVRDCLQCSDADSHKHYRPFLTEALQSIVLPPTLETAIINNMTQDTFSVPDRAKTVVLGKCAALVKFGSNCLLDKFVCHSSPEGKSCELVNWKSALSRATVIGFSGVKLAESDEKFSFPMCEHFHIDCPMNAQLLKDRQELFPRLSIVSFDATRIPDDQIGAYLDVIFSGHPATILRLAELDASRRVRDGVDERQRISHKFHHIVTFKRPGSD